MNPSSTSWRGSRSLLPASPVSTCSAFPLSDSDILKEWGDTRALLTYGRTPEEDQVAAAEAVLSMWKYVEGHVAARDAEPREDLTSDLIRLSASGRSS